MCGGGHRYVGTLTTVSLYRQDEGLTKLGIALSFLTDSINALGVAVSLQNLKTSGPLVLCLEQIGTRTADLKTGRKQRHANTRLLQHS